MAYDDDENDGDIDRLTRLVQPKKLTAFDVVDKIVDGGGKRLEITQKIAEPVRAESSKREHTFFDTAGFIAYVRKYKTAHTILFANPTAGKITAVLDETALKGRELVALTPMLHPHFAPWNTIANTRTTLDAFVDFISANRKSITKPDGKSLMLLLSQVKATTKRELFKGRGNNSTNGIVVTLKVQGEDTKQSIDIPSEIEIFVPLYVRDKRRPIDFDLILGTNADGDEIFVTLTSGDLLTIRTDAFDDMLAVISKELPDLTVTLGDPVYRNWDYLK